jgi:hypothetical protein
MDAIVALIDWDGKKSPNSDSSVKEVIGYLKYLASKYKLTIWIIGHTNKGKHDEISDMVMGARASIQST